MANLMLQTSVMGVVSRDRLPTRPDLVMKLTGDEGSWRWDQQVVYIRGGQTTSVYIPQSLQLSLNLLV